MRNLLNVLAWGLWLVAVFFMLLHFGFKFGNPNIAEEINTAILSIFPTVIHPENLYLGIGWFSLSIAIFTRLAKDKYFPKLKNNQL